MKMLTRRFLLLVLVSLSVWGCGSDQSQPIGKITIGVVSLERNPEKLDQYAKLQTYLGERLSSIIELEPTYNEIHALNQVKQQNWDIVFAPPGVAAIATSQFRYQPIFAMEGGTQNRSLILVRQENPAQNINDLSNKVVALGQPGSATGYYFPLFNLYGLTLAEIKFADTPEMVMQWIADKTVDAGAVSQGEYAQYRSQFPPQTFRVLATDRHGVPSGSVLLNPNLEARLQSQIKDAMTQVSPAIAASAGYLLEVPLPDYDNLIDVIEKINPIANQLKQTPAVVHE
ncbi:MAG: PhnD/SsuA/transferrin family substrate-binding protein [Synechocystis sp.]|nr:PhnD/SsuA/transferrin family substrate-binding protein [Synechocystis sp.]